MSQFDDLCEALSPAESVNAPARRGNSFSFNFQPNNATAIRETCADTFTNTTCTQNYDNLYNWAVETCVQYTCSSALDNCDCSTDGMYSVGATSEDIPAGGISATVWYNNQVSHMIST